jgi:hypothetical protein
VISAQKKPSLVGIVRALIGLRTDHQSVTGTRTHMPFRIHDLSPAPSLAPRGPMLISVRRNGTSSTPNNGPSRMHELVSPTISPRCVRLNRDIWIVHTETREGGVVVVFMRAEVLKAQWLHDYNVTQYYRCIYTIS